MAVLLLPKSPQNRASISRLETLAQLLPENWVVNGGGEVVDRDPIDVADFVKLGGVWIDYCGYPMYYRDDLFGNMWLGGNGFRRFLTQLSYNDTPNLGFSHTFMADDYGFEFDRSLVNLEATTPPWIEPSWNAPRTENIFSMFCIRQQQSQGAYFYAYGSGVWGIDAYAYYAFMALKKGLPPISNPDLGKFPWLLYGSIGAIGYLTYKAIVKGSEQK